MAFADFVGAARDAVAADWETTHPTWTAVLHVDDDYQPVVGSPLLLLADDGGPAVHRGAWMVGKTAHRPLLRLTAIAAGRDEALQVVGAGADYVLANKPGIARVEDVSRPLVTRDRKTGAILASITMPVIVKPVIA